MQEVCGRAGQLSSLRPAVLAAHPPPHPPAELPLSAVRAPPNPATCPPCAQVVWEDEAARAAAMEALARSQRHQRRSSQGGERRHSRSQSLAPSHVPPYGLGGATGGGSAAPSEAGNSEISADIAPASVWSGWSGRSAATVQPAAAPRRHTGSGYAASQAGSHAGSAAGGEHPATEQLRRAAARVQPGSPRGSWARAGRPFATKVGSLPGG